MSQTTHPSVEGEKGAFHECGTVAMRHEQSQVAHKTKERIDCCDGRESHGKGYLWLSVAASIYPLF